MKKNEKIDFLFTLTQPNNLIRKNIIKIVLQRVN
jgi:hypothetical protein